MWTHPCSFRCFVKIQILLQSSLSAKSWMKVGRCEPHIIMSFTHRQVDLLTGLGLPKTIKIERIGVQQSALLTI